jgi:hypothetical protein
LETIVLKPFKTRRGKLAVAAEVFWREADAMHSLLVEHADALTPFPAGSPEKTELGRIISAIEAYEAKRWPIAKVAGGKS